MNHNNINNMKGEKTSGSTSLNFEFYPEEGKTSNHEIDERLEKRIIDFQGKKVRFNNVLEALMSA